MVLQYPRHLLPKDALRSVWCGIVEEEWAMLEEGYCAACRDWSDITVHVLKTRFGARER